MVVLIHIGTFEKSSYYLSDRSFWTSLSNLNAAVSSNVPAQLLCVSKTPFQSPAITNELNAHKNVFRCIKNNWTTLPQLKHDQHKFSILVTSMFLIPTLTHQPNLRKSSVLLNADHFHVTLQFPSPGGKIIETF